MRFLLVLALAPALLAGCVDRIPYKDDFGVSALRPVGNIPPEFVRFNNYDPRDNALLAGQICATRDIPLEEKSLPAAPGEMLAWRLRCEPFGLRVGNVTLHVAP
jgi:hypothetical protein